jgi:hypothetical protein
MIRTLIHLIILLGILAFCGLFIILLDNSLDVYCIHPADQNAACKISKAFMGRYPVSTRALVDVVDVQKDRSCDDDCSYRALLVTSSGQKVPVNNVFTDEGPVLEQMASIRAFLDGAEQSFEYKTEAPGWVLTVFGGLGLVGALSVVISFAAGLKKR